MPLRKCIGCNEIKESPEMLKITRVHDSKNIILNPDSRYFGRSAYVCYNKECAANALKKKKLEKSLKMEIPDELTEQIKKHTGLI